jgi:hypothetical protein
LQIIKEAIPSASRVAYLGVQLNERFSNNPVMRSLKKWLAIAWGYP